jgi:hypothetical protein
MLARRMTTNLTPAQGQIIYVMDWAWQRGEETILTIRFYWWCAQFAILVVLPMVWYRYGARTTFCAVVRLVDWRYVYAERHSWTGTDEEPVSAVTLVITLRQEHEQRRLLPVLVAPDYGQRFVTPLDDRQAPWEDSDDWLADVVLLPRIRQTLALERIPERMAA